MTLLHEVCWDVRSHRPSAFKLETRDTTNLHSVVSPQCLTHQTSIGAPQHGSYHSHILFLDNWYALHYTSLHNITTFVLLLKKIETKQKQLLNQQQQ